MNVMYLLGENKEVPRDGGSGPTVIRNFNLQSLAFNRKLSVIIDDWDRFPWGNMQVKILK